MLIVRMCPDQLIDGLGRAVGGPEGDGGLTSDSRGPRVGADSRREHLRDPLNPASGPRQGGRRGKKGEKGQSGESRTVQFPQE